jgi:hypothetical protein
VNRTSSSSSGIAERSSFSISSRDNTGGRGAAAAAALAALSTRSRRVAEVRVAGEAGVEVVELAARFVEQLLDVEVDLSHLLERQLFEIDSAEERRFFDRRQRPRLGDELQLRQLFDHGRLAGERMDRCGRLVDDDLGLRLGLRDRELLDCLEQRLFDERLWRELDDFVFERQFATDSSSGSSSNAGSKLLPALRCRTRAPAKVHRDRTSVPSDVSPRTNSGSGSGTNAGGTATGVGRVGILAGSGFAVSGSNVCPRVRNSVLTALIAALSPFSMSKPAYACAATRAVDLALFEKDAEQALVCGEVLRRALEHSAQVFGRLLREPVLREHLGLGEVLGDEIGSSLDSAAISAAAISTAGCRRCCGGGGVTGRGAAGCEGGAGAGAGFSSSKSSSNGGDASRSRERSDSASPPMSNDGASKVGAGSSISSDGICTAGVDGGVCVRGGSVSTPPICERTN